MDDLLDPKDSELKKGKLHDDDDESFPDNDFDDDFLGEKSPKKKPLVEEESDSDSLDKLAEDELDELDEPYDDVDEW